MRSAHSTRSCRVLNFQLEVSLLLLKTQTASLFFANWIGWPTSLASWQLTTQPLLTSGVWIDPAANWLATSCLAPCNFSSPCVLLDCPSITTL